MNILLIIRSEIIAIFILVFFLIYNQVCARYREGKDYFKRADTAMYQEKDAYYKKKGIERRK